MKWRLILSEPGPGYWNMAVDEALLDSVQRHLVPPTLRLYYWQPPAVSLGYFQRVEEEIDLEACARQGIDVVRRPTGGRAVLHDAEITYSITVPRNMGIPASVIRSYLWLSRGLLAGLRKLGIAAELTRGMRGRSLSAACFDSSSWYEIVVAGRKLVGSAQVRKKEAILQHGSLLLDFDPELLSRLLRCQNPGQRELLCRHLRAKVTSVKNELGTIPPREELEKALVAGFAAELEVEFTPGELTKEERALAARLEEKYRHIVTDRSKMSRKDTG